MHARTAVLLIASLLAAPASAQTKPLDTIPVVQTYTKTLAGKHNEVVKRLNATTARVDSIVRALTPAPVPTPTPPPVPVPPPTPAPDTSSGVVSSDRFAYASTAALRASSRYNAIESNLALVSLDTAVRYNGHATVRSDMPANSAALGKLAVPVPSLSNVWLRVVLRFSDGFTTTGTLTSSANSLKLIGWGWAGADGRGDLEITNTTEYQLHWNVPPGFVSQSAGQVRNEWSDGGWHTYVIHYQATSGTTTRTRWWYAPPGGALTLRATANGSGSARSVREFAWPFYFNQSRRAAQSMWTGEWTIVDGSRSANPFGVP